MTNWTECTEERYWDMLEVLPPAVMGSSGFMVGEPTDHCPTTGRPRFAAFIKRDGKHYEADAPMTIKQFREHVPTARDYAYSEADRF